MGSIIVIFIVYRVEQSKGRKEKGKMVETTSGGDGSDS